MNSQQIEEKSKILPIITTIFSIYFFILFINSSGFLPNCPISGCQWLLLIFSFIFAIIPFFNKIKIGKIVELERELQKTKNEFSEYKDFTFHQFTMLSSNINTISNLQNTININIPGIEDLNKAKTELDSYSEGTIEEDANEIKEELVLEGEDMMMALVKTRIRLEGLLRKILGKRKYTKSREGKPVKYFALYKLFMMFIQENKEYQNLIEPFKYVNQLYNAAAHAQIVSDGQALEALEIGTRLIAILMDYDKKIDSQK